MKKVTLSLVVLAIAVSSFLLGGFLGSRAAHMQLEKKNYYLSMLNAVPQYSTSVEISAHIQNNRYDHAKCIADLTASIYYREIQGCLADRECGDVIRDEVRRVAPELLSDDKSKFAYYANLERCNLVK
jgi:hypothetical protein